MYAKEKALWQPNRIFTARGRDDRYNQFIVNKEQSFEKWQFITLADAFARSLGIALKEARKIIRTNPEELNEFVLSNHKSVIRPARPDYKSVSEAARNLIDKSKNEPESVFRLECDNYPDMFLVRGERILFYTDKLKLIDGEYIAGEPLSSLWDDVLSNNLHKEGGISFPKGKKPEALLKRVIELSTDAGDIVLDSFAGSGTTGAVAHKMGRRWIMVELGRALPYAHHPAHEDTSSMAKIRVA